MEVAASVAGLISLADLTFRVVYKYVRAAKEAEKDVKNLKREIEGLCSVLRTLQALTDILVTEEEKDNSALSTDILQQCKGTLEKIRTKVLDAFASFEQKQNQILKSTLQRLKWPFSAAETNEILNTLSRYKLTLSMATSADSLSKLHIILNNQVEHNIKIEEAVKNIDASTKLIANIVLDKEKRRILHFFMSTTLNPRQNLDQSIELREPTTGTWLMASIELQSWLTNSGSLLWFYGIPGGGKTILAGLVIQKAMARNSEEVGVAFFFCDYKNPETLRLVNILGAIAVQLALQNDASYEILKKYHEDLNPPNDLATTPDVDGLGRIIASMIKTFRQVLIVVDGLDECGNEMGSVTMSLADFASLDTPASVALFSRQEPNIRARMGDDFTEIPIEAHTEDVEIYVRAELEKRIQSRRLRLSDPETAHKIEEELVRRADGMFRWVACQLDSLCDLFTDQDRLEALKQLPETLHDSYRRLLERVNTKPRTTQKRVQLCLQFIAFFPKKLSILELCQAVSTPEDIGNTLNRGNIVVEEDIVHHCSSLIRKSAKGDAFEFAHFSVQEFLESDMAGLEKYKLSRQESSSLLALQCLKFVQLGNSDVLTRDRKKFREKQNDLDNELPFYRHAAAYWPMLLRASPERSDQSLTQATESLFGEYFSPKLRTWIFWFLATLYDCPATKCPVALDIALDEQIEPLHLASALNIPELCFRLLEDGADPKLNSRLGPPLVLAAISFLGALETEVEDLAVDSEVFLRLLPTAKQRQSTMDCLMKEATLSDISQYPSLFSYTVIVSCHLQDFRPVITLLSNGITPTTADIDLFGSYLNKWWSHCQCSFNREGSHQKKASLKFEASIRTLNRHLQDTSAFEHEWGFELGKVLWIKAVAMELSFTRDPSLTHREISISLETVRERIMLAISSDSPHLLSHHLEDRRVSVFDSWSWDDSPSRTLLHHATSRDALQCVDLILSRGCDPYALSGKGVPALHEIDITKNGNIIDTFLAHGISLLGTDSDQWTLWHVCANDGDSSADFMLKLFSAKPEETQIAVLMKNGDGHTPLALALSNDLCPNSDFEELEDSALSFIKHCSDVSGFWGKHDAILPRAFNFGSEKVMNRLFELGFKPDPFVAGNPTPLHELGANVSPAWVKFLMATFPGAVECRYSDRLPIENYADACVKEGESADEEVLGMLASTTILQSRDRNGVTPWEYSCHNMVRLRRQVQGHISASSWKALRLVWIHYITLGASRAHEEAVGGCGAGVLLSALWNYFKAWADFKNFKNLCSSMVEKAILASRSWNPSADDIVRFLSLSIIGRRKDMVEIFLKHGVDVHQRIDGVSAIETACDSETSTDLCSRELGRNMLKSLLDHSDHRKLREFDIGRRGLGLLHRIASTGQEPHVRWLMGELVGRGVDVNGFDLDAEEAFRMTPLTHHIYAKSICYAGYLLELGADPSFHTNHDVGGHFKYIDAVPHATHLGNISFLRKLFDFSRTLAFKACQSSINENLQYGQTTWREKVSSLHLACYRGFYEIAEFFIKNKLLSYDITSDKGLTPLHMAALGGHARIINYLIEQGQEIDILTKSRTTALHCAAMNGHIEATKALLAQRAQGSIDTYSRTPRTAASVMGHKSIVALLDAKLGIYDEMKFELIQAHRQKQNLLGQMREAITSGNIPDCRVIAANGCPLNEPISRSDGSTPLDLALKMTQWQTAIALLNLGASTLTHSYDVRGYNRSVLDQAAWRSDLTDLLPHLLEAYLEQGGDLTNGPESPIFFAATGNVIGMRIILSYFGKHNGQSGHQYSDDISNALERRLPVTPFIQHTQDEVTALHIAVMYNQMEITQLLLESGANVDSTSAYGLSPIQMSMSSDMTSLLMSFGASTVPVLAMSLVEAMYDWASETSKRARSFKSMSMVDDAMQMMHEKELWLGLDMIPERFTTTMTDWRHLLAVRHLQVPLKQYLGSNSKLGNYLLGFSAGHCFFLNGDYQLEKLEPFPWYQIGGLGFNRLLFLRHNFRFFQRRFSRSVFKQWLNLEPDRGWSPLCRAASMDFLDMIENCLSIGADIDFEGCSWGSALMTASAFGKLASVKFLVRAGARIDYIGSRGHTSALLVTVSKVVKQWLLVERFVEQRKIEAATERDKSHSMGQKGRRSGIARIKVRLNELYYRRYGESSLDYLRRLERLKLEMRGRIPYYTDGVIYEDTG
ncbi:unnamed protein product [Fusarium graminearum]|uniref:NACHT domain-containing protein n=1 Tax=Gibberella zeae TaxID=5518 RepID=A0A8H3K3Z6_GIBZA|nr:hypothetical protein FG05_08215 [Fusarium graminearum]CAG1973068.1 unnamed protein product [Fusarium graminearum]CAG1977322.1 unnamed protein product [Fusarium graminearum]CAG1985980.1 unnamed protein product [Fusarium graminearum]